MGRRRGRIGGGTAVAVALLLIAAPPALATSASGALRAIRRHDGASAVASPIVHTSIGEVALVAHALHVVDRFGDGTHTVADAYRWRRGAWRRLSRVDFGVKSNAPARGAPPQLVHLTGATDFLVTTVGAGGPQISIVSDVGGHWHLIPFVGSGRSKTAEAYGSVHGNRVRSGVDDCRPDCTRGKITYTTWVYSATGTFRPINAPPPSCGGLSTVALGNLQAIGCFRRSSPNTYQTATRFRLDGIDFAPAAHTSFEIRLGGNEPQVDASGSGCLQATITNPGNDKQIGELPLKCWTRATSVSLADDAVTLASGSIQAGGQVGPNINGFLGGLALLNVTLTLSPGFGAQLTATASVGTVLGNSLLSGQLNADLTNKFGLLVDQLCVASNSSLAGQDFYALPAVINGAVFPIKSFRLCYLPVLGELFGSVSVALPFFSPNGVQLQLKGSLGLRLASFVAPGGYAIPVPGLGVSVASIGLGLQNTDIPLGDSGLFLQRLGGQIIFYPVTGYSGSVGISLGPEVPPVNFELLSLNGTASISFGGDDGFSDFFYANDPYTYLPEPGVNHGKDVINLGGHIDVFSTSNGSLATLAKAHAKLVLPNGIDTFNGTLSLPLFTDAGLSAKVQGEIEYPHFTAGGEGTFTLFGDQVMGQVLLSDKGVGGCGPVGAAGVLLGGIDPFGFGLGDIEVGFKIVSDQFSAFEGCELSDLTTVGSASAANDTDGAKVVVPHGVAVEEFAVKGRGSSPRVTVVGPENRVINTPIHANRLTADNGAFTVADETADTTYFIVSRPHAGTWTIDADAGSSPIESVSHAGPLPPARVRVKLRRRARGRERLTWHFAGAPGRTVMLIDRSTSAHPLILTSHAHGALTFMPTLDGSPGRRKIIAVVEQAGLPKSTRTVAFYTASRSRLAAVRGLRAKRRGRRVYLRWRAVAGAQSYLVRVSLGHHRTEAAILRRTVRRFSVVTTSSGAATVIAGGPGLAPSPRRSVHFGAAGRRRHRGHR